jgi:hypothetical protein
MVTMMTMAKIEREMGFRARLAYITRVKPEIGGGTACGGLLSA